VGSAKLVLCKKEFGALEYKVAAAPFLCMIQNKTKEKKQVVQCDERYKCMSVKRLHQHKSIKEDSSCKESRNVFSQFSCFPILTLSQADCLVR
jgi:hypothetical protein